MTEVDKHTNEHHLETPDSIQLRFGISYVESRPAEAIAALTMPMERFRNPFTGAPTVGPLAVLVDAAASIVNHYRRRPGQWTVSSELSMDLSLDGVGTSTVPCWPPRTHLGRWARHPWGSALGASELPASVLRRR
jgi:hypothetical protein